MNDEQAKKLTLQLVSANSEREVVKILRDHNLWDDEESWKTVNESTGNWSTIGSQQSSADTALVEKIINSVDAVLMRECKRAGMRPDSEDAPRSIPEAQRKYFRIYNGKLSSLDITERIKLASNIYLVATGNKTNPSYSIIDLGEGQSPEFFPETFLSLNKSNKDRVHFVQGKFGMGGTGVFRFASPEHNLQLIISKKDPAIKCETNSGKWGVTIIRRMPPTPDMRSSIFTYLAPKGEILSFNSISLPLLPGKHPIAYSEPMGWGSFIKLYEYDLARLKSNIRIDLFYRLSLLMPDIALPITMVERRGDYDDADGKTRDMTIIMAGLSVRLDADRQNNLEDNFPSTGELSAKAQKMDYSIYAFKKGRRKTYSGNEGVIFTFNGQAHGFLSKSFFERDSVRMNYLSDSILVLVDCSKIDKRSFEDLFMNSRDRLSEGPLKGEIVRQLEDILKNHPGLKALRERRRREDIEDKLHDSKPLADVLESIISKSPSLSSLFVKGLRIKNPFNLVGASEEKVFHGRPFPTFFRLTKELPNDRPKTIPLNVRRFKVQFETDAENDYFDRDKDPAEKTVELNGSMIQDYSWNLWNGLATLNVELPATRKEGNEYSYSTSVNDINKIEPFLSEFCIKIEKPQEKSGGEPGKRKMPRGDDSGDRSQKPSYLDLPNAWEVRKEDWEKHDFNERSALRVVPVGENNGYDFYINMENTYLQMEIKQNVKVDSRLMEARFKYSMVLVGISLLDFEEKQRTRASTPGDEAQSVYEKIDQVSNAIAPILLPMIAALGDLVLEPNDNDTQG